MSSPLELVRKSLSPADGDIEHAVLHHFVIGGGCLGPPVPIEELSGWLGFQIVLLSGMEDDFSGIVSLRDRLIGINAHHHPRRRRFSIAHELGHVVLAHPPEHRITLEASRRLDREANRCAAELLMPLGLLMPHLARRLSLVQLATIFAVSEQAMVHRLKSLSVPGVLPQSVFHSRRG